jgi:hypothetical protein
VNSVSPWRPPTPAASCCALVQALRVARDGRVVSVVTACPRKLNVCLDLIRNLSPPAVA